MKTKILVIVGILIIAFAAMVAPVMAADPVQISGGTASTFSFTMVNTSLTFGTFAAGSNYISPSHPDTVAKFAVVDLTTNAGAWTISQKGLNSGHMANGGHTLAAALGIKNASVISGTTLGQTSALALTGSDLPLFTGTLIEQTYIPLEISQVVTAADPYDTGYANTITFTYTNS